MEKVGPIKKTASEIYSVRKQNGAGFLYSSTACTVGLFQTKIIYVFVHSFAVILVSMWTFSDQYEPSFMENRKATPKYPMLTEN